MVSRDQNKNGEVGKGDVGKLDDINNMESVGSTLDGHPIKSPPCHLCANMATQKPTSIKTKESMRWVLDQTSQGNNGMYICLLGIHLQYINEGWKLADNSCITKEMERSYDDAKEKLARFNIGNGFMCMLIPKRNKNPARWLIKRIETTSEETHKKAGKPDEERLTAQRSSICNSISSMDESFELPSRQPVVVNKMFSSIINSIKEAKKRIDSNEMLDTAKHAKLHILESANVAKSTFEVISGKRVPAEGNRTYSNHGALPAELLDFQTIYTKPLQVVIINICTMFDNLSTKDKYSCGDDVKTPAIGWLIRGDLCTAIAKLLRVGLSDGVSILNQVFGKKKEEITLWKLVKEFSLSYVTNCFIAVIDYVESSRWIVNDDMRFRFFICELLNRNTLNGREKLIVTWFKNFRYERRKIMKHYVAGSFWRMDYNEHFSILFEEIVHSLMLLNGIPFHLHAFFEMELVQFSENSQQTLENKECGPESNDIICVLE